MLAFLYHGLNLMILFFELFTVSANFNELSYNTKIIAVLKIRT